MPGLAVYTEAAALCKDPGTESTGEGGCCAAQRVRLFTNSNLDQRKV